MSASTTACAAATAAARPARLVKCRVSVRTATGEQHSYTALFPGTCDAVLDALDRFGIAKIKVAV